MERRTAIAIATGVTLSVASVVAAVGLNLGLMADRTPTTGPGAFEPVAAEITTTTIVSSSSLPASGSAPVMTVDRDNVERSGDQPDAHDSDGHDADHDASRSDASSDHELGHDDDD